MSDKITFEEIQDVRSPERRNADFEAARKTLNSAIAEVTKMKAEKSPLQKAADLLEAHNLRSGVSMALLERALHDAYLYVLDVRAQARARAGDVTPAQQARLPQNPFAPPVWPHDEPAQQGENKRCQVCGCEACPWPGHRSQTERPESRAEQGKTVEQSNPKTANHTHACNPLPMGDKQEPGHTVTPAVEAPVSSTCGPHCPLCGWLPLRPGRPYE